MGDKKDLLMIVQKQNCMLYCIWSLCEQSWNTHRIFHIFEKDRISVHMEPRQEEQHEEKNDSFDFRGSMSDVSHNWM